jgi:hypothetical protein
MLSHDQSCDAACYLTQPEQHEMNALHWKTYFNPHSKAHPSIEELAALHAGAAV